MENITKLAVIMVNELRKEFKEVELTDINLEENVLEFKVNGFTVNTLATLNMTAFMANIIKQYIWKSMVGDNANSIYKQKLFFKALEEGKVPAKVASYKKYSIAKLEALVTL